MSDITLNGIPVIRGNLKEPYQGAYTAEVDIEADFAPSGPQQLVILGETFAMSVVAEPDDPDLKLSGDSGGFQRCLLVAGAGGLRNPIEADERAQGAIVGDLLQALLQGTGEALADDIDPLLLGQGLAQWSWVAGTVEDALSALCAYLGVVWRVRADGKVWIGTPVATPRTPPEYVITDIAPETGQASWSLNDVTAKPDDQIEGLTLRELFYSWEGNEFRALVTYAPGPFNGLFFLMSKWLARLNIEYFRLAPGRVAGQNGPTCQFQPDNTQISPLRKTGLRFGLPDCDVQNLMGGRAVVGWEGASPIGPITTGFAPGPLPTGQIGKLRLGLSSAGPPAGTQPTIKGTTFRLSQSTLDLSLQILFASIGVALESAAGEAGAPSLATAAKLFDGTLLPLPPTAGVVQAISRFENEASTNSNFLTTIVEVG